MFRHGTSLSHEGSLALEPAASVATCSFSIKLTSLAVAVSKTHKGAEGGFGGRYLVCKGERERKKKEL